ncbi:FxsA family protein [Devosia sp.]|uniref:FxsA family protein n=1 Tax=Devosia sp. TaxID=1871048 RepID=UPI003A8CBB52
MGRILFAIFVIVPVIEIGIFVALGSAIGFWPTMLGVIVTAVIGSIVLRYQGLSLLAQIRGTMAQGQLPAKALAEAMMVGIAGALMLTPGYFTDTIGALLLIPVFRSAIYDGLRSRFTVATFTSTAGPGGPRGPTGPSDPKGPRPVDSDGTIDLDDDEWRPRQ